MRSNEEQIRFGKRYGNLPKTPVALNTEGKVWAGSAKYPPIVGPMIVPIDHTKGSTA
jgi:hypothetical protein